MRVRLAADRGHRLGDAPHAAAQRTPLRKLDRHLGRGRLGVDLDRETPFYLFCLLLLVVLALAARNLARSKMGRAFAAVRDRDIAAGIMGVPLLRTKVVAFGVSSFYAGVAGGLLAVARGQITPENWNLLLSIDFLAVILIGGVATISGSMIGAVFVVLLPRFVHGRSKDQQFVPGASAAFALTEHLALEVSYDRFRLFLLVCRLLLRRLLLVRGFLRRLLLDGLGLGHVVAAGGEEQREDGEDREELPPCCHVRVLSGPASS